MYVCAIEGRGWHDLAWGQCSVENPRKDSFRVVLYARDAHYINPAWANHFWWQVNYAATVNPAFGGSTPYGNTPWHGAGCHWGGSGCHHLFADSSLSRMKLNGNVNVVTSLAGVRNLHYTLGSSAVYNVSPRGFRTHIYTPWHSSTSHSRYRDKWSVNFIATTTGRGSFESGRSPSNTWRTNWGLNHYVYTRKAVPYTPVFVVSVSGTSSHWTSRGTGSLWRSDSRKFLQVLNWNCGLGCAHRYRWQTNFIAGSSYADLLVAEVKVLTIKAKVLSRTAADLSKAAADKNSRSVAAQAAVTKASAALRGARTAGTALTADSTKLAAKKAQLTTKIRQLQASGTALKRALDRAVTSLRADAKQAKGEYAAVKLQEQGLASNLEAAADQLSKLQASTSKTTSALAAAGTAIDVARVAAASAATALTTRTAQLKSAESQAKSNKAAQQTAVDALSKQVEALRQAVGDADAARAKLVADTQTLQRRIDSAKANLQPLSDETSTARDDLAALRQRAASDVADHHKVLDEEALELPQLSEDAKLLRDEAEREQAKFKDEQDQLDKLHQTMKASKQELQTQLARVQQAKHNVDLQVSVTQHVADDAARQGEHEKAKLGAIRDHIQETVAAGDKAVAQRQGDENQRTSVLGAIHHMTQTMAAQAEDAQLLADKNREVKAAMAAHRRQLEVLAAKQRSMLHTPEVMQVLQAAQAPAKQRAEAAAAVQLQAQRVQQALGSGSGSAGSAGSVGSAGSGSGSSRAGHTGTTGFAAGTAKGGDVVTSTTTSPHAVGTFGAHPAFTGGVVVETGYADTSTVGGAGQGEVISGPGQP